jgi:hypothetical protein
MAGRRERFSTSFLDGGGKMGALMRAHNWTNSPLGDPAAWPDALKMAVGTCLSSRFVDTGVIFPRKCRLNFPQARGEA